MNQIYNLLLCNGLSGSSAKIFKMICIIYYILVLMNSSIEQICGAHVSPDCSLSVVPVIRHGQFHNLTFILDISTSGASIMHSSPYAKMKSLPNIYFKMCPLPESAASTYIIKTINVANLTSIEFEIDHGYLENSSKKIHLPELTKFVKELTAASQLTDATNQFDDLFINVKNSTNKLKLPEGLFDGLPKLTKLGLEDNDISELPKEIFNNLNELRALDLNTNELRNISKDLFRGLPQLYSLNLNKNKIEYLDEDVFQTQTKLEVLNINHNKMNAIPTHLFKYLNKLKILDLSFNRIGNIDNFAFAGLTNLEILDLSNNDIFKVNYDAFRGTEFILTTLNLANNNISSVYPYTIRKFMPESAFKHLKTLANLDLSNNSLDTLFSDWRNNYHLQNLNLSYNRITCIDKDVDMQFVRNTTVDLSHNLISHLIWENFIKKKLKAKIILNFNPLHCNCDVYRFLTDENIKVLETKDLYCASPKNLQGIQINEINPETVVSSIPPRRSLSEICPEECFCRMRCQNRALIVNCSYSHLTVVPSLVNIDYISAIKFNFTELYIQGNQINILPNLNHTFHVRKINAEFNKISELSLDNIPPNIEVLQLAHNNLAQIDNSILAFFGNKTKIKKLTLGFNPWSCNCKSTDLVLYLRSIVKIIDDIDNITCCGKKLSHLSINDMCYTRHAVWIPMLVIGACSGILIGVMIAVFYYYQHEIKVLLFANGLCMWFVAEEELDKDKQFDAFISYSHKDEDFVEDQLVRNLENGDNPYKLCLYYRNWIAGEWITTQIENCVQNSRRTIVVLSRNFLESVWGKTEFRTAHSKALAEDRGRVIIIMYEDIGQLGNLDSECELRAYLSTNTYLKWGDPLFWSKLRYALPHHHKNRNSQRSDEFISMGLIDEK